MYVAWPTAAQPSPGQASETIAGCVVGALLGFVAWMVVLSLPGVWRYPNASFTLGIGAVVIAAFLGAARGGFARRT